MNDARKALPDIVGTILLVAIGAAFAIGGSGYGIFGEGGRIGPGFMPFMTGILVAVFGAMVGLEAFRRSRRPEDEVPERYEIPTDGEAEASSARTVGIVFAMTLAAILLTALAGFLPAFGLLVFALVRFVEKESIVAAAAFGVGSAVAAWLVFVLFLQIPLPVGVFGP
ncbi:MAG: tripartite tricarboxylate transporter TctB family protein [Rubrobacteraceae bacterium]